MGFINNSATVEKVKRTRKKCHARPTENVAPKGVKNTKMLASKVDCSELPCKKRLVFHSGHELSDLMVEAVVQPCQQQRIFYAGTVRRLETLRQSRSLVI